jgi:hypothetical protein
LVSTPALFAPGCGNMASGVNKINPYKTYKCLPQHVPSYIAVMLNVTDSADGFSFIPRAHSPFPPVQSYSCTRGICRSSLARSLRYTFRTR